MHNRTCMFYINTISEAHVHTCSTLIQSTITLIILLCCVQGIELTSDLWCIKTFRSPWFSASVILRCRSPDQVSRPTGYPSTFQQFHSRIGCWPDAPLETSSADNFRQPRLSFQQQNNDCTLPGLPDIGMGSPGTGRTYVSYMLTSDWFQFTYIHYCWCVYVIIWFCSPVHAYSLC